MFENAHALASDIANFACTIGLSPDLLELLIDIYPKTKDVDIKVSELLQCSELILITISSTSKKV